MSRNKEMTAEDYKNEKDWEKRKRPSSTVFKKVDWPALFDEEKGRLLANPQFVDLLRGIEAAQFEWDRYLIMGDFCLDEDARLLALIFKWCGEHMATPHLHDSIQRWMWSVDFYQNSNVHSLRILIRRHIDWSDTFLDAMIVAGIILVKLRENLCVSGDIEWRPKEKKRKRTPSRKGKSDG